MGIPYLETGESIILTTGRVSINSIRYDVLLTTRNLILVDDRYGDFQPRIYPLSRIQSVKGGKTTSGELAITLFFADTSGTGEPGAMFLIFSQQPAENRKRERDDWLKKLMELIVSVRQKTVDNGLSSPAPEIGIRPSMRRPVAPEIPPPYTRVIHTHTAPIDMTIVHDEPEPPVFSGEGEALMEEAFTEEDAQPNVASAPRAEGGPPGIPDEVSGSPKSIPALRHSDEDTDDTRDHVPESPEIQPAPYSGTEYTEGGGEQIPGSPDTCSSHISGSGYPDSTPEHEPGPADTVSFPDSQPEEKSFENGPVTASPPLSVFEERPVDSSDVPELPPMAESAAESPPAQQENAEGLPIPGDAQIERTGTPVPENSGSLDLPAAPEPVIVASAPVPVHDTERSEMIHRESGEGKEADREPADAATPPVPEPAPPSRSPGYRRPSFIAITAIILIVLGIAVAAIFYLYPVAAPGTQPTPIPISGGNQTPVPGPSIQQFPVPAQVVIPPSGVWVRVLYSRNYSGWVGIPMSLREVAGSGDQIYQIIEPDGIIQVLIQKVDNSGETLTVEVYRDGDLINQRKISKPMGSIEFLIDTRTALPPGITPVATQLNNQTGSSGKIMYF